MHPVSQLIVSFIILLINLIYEDEYGFLRPELTPNFVPS